MITIKLVRELADQCEESLTRCKTALIAADGDMDKAKEYLRSNNIPSLSELRVVRLEERVARLEAALAKLIE